MITKGEWKVFNGTDVFTNNNRNGTGDVQICDCEVWEPLLKTDNELPIQEALSNAQLIASAPKLYEACKELIHGNIAKAIEIADNTLIMLKEAGV